MRITADIIDEEGETGCRLCNEALQVPLSKGRADRVEEELRKFAESPDKVQAEQRKKNEVNYEQQKKYWYNPEWMLKLEKEQSRELKVRNAQNDKFKDMCSKFGQLNISGEDYQIRLPNRFQTGEDYQRRLPNRFQTGEDYQIRLPNRFQTAEQFDSKRNMFMQVVDSCRSDYFNKMEDMKKAQASSSRVKSDEENPPLWLLKYLNAMKQEIKKEILEELMNCPQNETHGYSAFAGKLDENQLPGNVFHPDLFCYNCDQLIHGIRYKCGNCVNFDLCEECESLPNIHNKNHRFLKIKSSVPVKSFKQNCQPIVIPSPNGQVSFGPVLKTHLPKKLYEAKFVCDETVPDGTYFPPSTTFIKSWRVLNSGKRVWTHSTKLRLIQGSVGLTPASEHVDVPHLRPGEEGIVSVLFTTPAVPGLYRSHWNFCHKSRPFGHIVWCHIIVRDTESEETQVENSSKTLKLPASGLHCEKEKEVASIAKVLTAVKEEHEKGNIIPRKLAVNSHTATPNNTPFDLTPPKSPDHQAMNELKVVVEDKESVPTSLSVVEYDAEEESVVSLSSSDSDAEFVVIPLPNCFNLSESLTSHNLSHLSQYLQTENVSDLKILKPSDQKIAKPQSIALKSALNAETVSQETGVPELSETGQKILISHNVNADGSSSEISIIESGNSSPIAENIVPDISSIHIAVTDDVESDDGEDSEASDEEDLVVNGEEPVSARKNSIHYEIPAKDAQQTVPDWLSKNSNHAVGSSVQYGDQRNFGARDVRNQGKSVDLDNRLSEKQKKLLKELAFHEILNKKVDMNKINLNVIKPWIAERITDITGIEDLTLVDYVFNQLKAEEYTDPRIMQMNLIRFLNAKNAREFMTDLWTLLVSAQDSADGIPAALLEQKKDETKKTMDQTDIPGSSATFPKFPVEGITSIYEPASSNTEERTVQVLPEKIVTVPLNVASTVYNATMQVMTNLRRQYTDSQSNQEGATGASSKALNPMDQLIEMGFCNRQQNEELLKKHKNDVALVVGTLVNLNDNDWYASRHIPPSAPTYN